MRYLARPGIVASAVFGILPTLIAGPSERCRLGFGMGEDTQDLGSLSSCGPLQGFDGMTWFPADLGWLTARLFGLGCSFCPSWMSNVWRPENACLDPGFNFCSSAWKSRRIHPPRHWVEEWSCTCGWLCGQGYGYLYYLYKILHLRHVYIYIEVMQGPWSCGSPAFWFVEVGVLCDDVRVRRRGCQVFGKRLKAAILV